MGYKHVPQDNGNDHPAKRSRISRDGFKRVANKFGVVLVPSIDMHIHGVGQDETCTALWETAIGATPYMNCQYVIIGKSNNYAKLRKEEILDGHPDSSLKQLE